MGGYDRHQPMWGAGERERRKDYFMLGGVDGSSGLSSSNSSAGATIGLDPSSPPAASRAPVQGRVQGNGLGDTVRVASKASEAEVTRVLDTVKAMTDGAPPPQTASAGKTERGKEYFMLAGVDMSRRMDDVSKRMDDARGQLSNFE